MSDTKILSGSSSDGSCNSNVQHNLTSFPVKSLQTCCRQSNAVLRVVVQAINYQTLALVRHSF